MSNENAPQEPVKKKKGGAAPDLVVKSKCKEVLKGADCNVAGDALEPTGFEDAEDGALFAPTKVPGRTGRAEDAKVRDAALRQWRAMAA